MPSTRPFAALLATLLLSVGFKAPSMPFGVTLLVAQEPSASSQETDFSMSLSAIPDFFIVLQFLLLVDDFAQENESRLNRFLSRYRISSTNSYYDLLLVDAARARELFSERTHPDDFPSHDAHSQYQKDRLRENARDIGRRWGALLLQVQESDRDHRDFVQLIRADLEQMMTLSGKADADGASFLHDAAAVFTEAVQQELGIGS